MTVAVTCENELTGLTLVFSDAMGCLWMEYTRHSAKFEKKNFFGRYSFWRNWPYTFQSPISCRYRHFSTECFSFHHNLKKRFFFFFFFGYSIQMYLLFFTYDFEKHQLEPNCLRSPAMYKWTQNQSEAHYFDISNIRAFYIVSQLYLTNNIF